MPCPSETGGRLGVWRMEEAGWHATCPDSASSRRVAEEGVEAAAGDALEGGQLQVVLVKGVVVLHPRLSGENAGVEDGVQALALLLVSAVGPDLAEVVADRVGVFPGPVAGRQQVLLAPGRLDQAEPGVLA